MLLTKYPEYFERMAIGLVGQGSECFGFDDEISTDHDFGPAFCIWLNEQDFQTIGFKLMMDYDKLPKEFMGVSARIVTTNGGGRVGVHETGMFYQNFIGNKKAPENLLEWLYIPEGYLATATNGKVFVDNLGEFSEIRGKLLEFYPEDVRKKKIAARAAVMAQSGQYNYARLMKRGEYVGACLALSEFVKTTISMVHLLNKKYMPFYKWSFKSMTTLPKLEEVQEKIQLLATMEFQQGVWEGTEKDAYVHTLNTNDKKVVLIEEICASIVKELQAQNLTGRNDDFLENHTMEIMGRIEAPEIRNRHVMEG
ncbi:MAG: DUF4037 domain-containing protein [Lachnospiraceae bacterium]|nr:DUF4037 domain-containing protein [Lachnospiraceae bacterium]